MSNIHIGDEVTINAVVVDVTASGNVMVKLNKGGRVMVSPEEINTIHPYQEISKEDKRRGN